MKLAYKKMGAGSPLIIIHGLYGSSDNWVTVGRQLAEYFEVWIVDQRNHGQSGHDSTMNYDAMSSDLEEFMNEHNIPQASLLGHSMGGKTAMFFARKHPQRVVRLMVADISPASYHRGSFSTQMGNHLDLIHAMLSVNFALVDSRQDVDAQLQEFIPQDKVRMFLLKNLMRDKGRWRWRINLWAISDSLHAIMSGLDVEGVRAPLSSFPVLFVKGGLSDYIQDKDLALIHEYFADYTVKTITQAGHWLHAEAPDEFVKIILDFVLRAH